jgi:hypothetical protein
MNVFRLGIAPEVELLSHQVTYVLLSSYWHMVLQSIKSKLYSNKYCSTTIIPYLCQYLLLFILIIPLI